MADKAKYFRAVEGITDGVTHYETGRVFVGSETLLDHFDRTDGKYEDRVLYETATKSDFDEYRKSLADPNSTEALAGVVEGAVDADGEPVEPVDDSATDTDGTKIESDSGTPKPVDHGTQDEVTNADEVAVKEGAKSSPAETAKKAASRGSARDK